MHQIHLSRLLISTFSTLQWSSQVCGSPKASHHYNCKTPTFIFIWWHFTVFLVGALWSASFPSTFFYRVNTLSLKQYLNKLVFTWLDPVKHVTEAALYTAHSQKKLRPSQSSALCCFFIRYSALFPPLPFSLVSLRELGFKPFVCFHFIMNSVSLNLSILQPGPIGTLHSISTSLSICSLRHGVSWGQMGRYFHES